MGEDSVKMNQLHSPAFFEVRKEFGFLIRDGQSQLTLYHCMGNNAALTSPTKLLESVRNYNMAGHYEARSACLYH
jgi:hypothetical protein